MIFNLTSDYEYPVTMDLIDAVFAIVKAKMRWAIANGHVELLLDPDTLKRQIENETIGSCIGFVATPPYKIEEDEDNNDDADA